MKTTRKFSALALMLGLMLGMPKAVKAERPTITGLEHKRGTLIDVRVGSGGKEVDKKFPWVFSASGLVRTEISAWVECRDKNIDDVYAQVDGKAKAREDVGRGIIRKQFKLHPHTSTVHDIKNLCSLNSAKAGHFKYHTFDYKLKADCNGVGRARTEKSSGEIQVKCVYDPSLDRQPTGGGNAHVFYGHGSSFVYKAFADGARVKCDNNTFGRDPKYGTKKACYLGQSRNQRHGSPVAHEGEYFIAALGSGDSGDRENNTIVVYYGKPGAEFNTREYQPGDSFMCDNATFGDPAPNVKKACYLGSRNNRNRNPVAQEGGRYIIPR